MVAKLAPFSPLSADKIRVSVLDDSHSSVAKTRKTEADVYGRADDSFDLDCLCSGPENELVKAGSQTKFCPLLPLLFYLVALGIVLRLCHLAVAHKVALRLRRNSHFKG